MRITYDPAAAAVYIHLTGQPLPPTPPPSKPAPSTAASMRKAGNRITESEITETYEVARQPHGGRSPSYARKD